MHDYQHEPDPTHRVPSAGPALDELVQAAFRPPDPDQPLRQRALELAVGVAQEIELEDPPGQTEAHRVAEGVAVVATRFLSFLRGQQGRNVAPGAPGDRMSLRLRDYLIGQLDRLEGLRVTGAGGLLDGGAEDISVEYGGRRYVILIQARPSEPAASAPLPGGEPAGEGG